MKIALINLPGSSPFSPPLGLLSLAAYLRNNGIEVLPVDASIDALHYILSPECIKEKILISKRIMEIKGLKIDPHLLKFLAEIALEIDQYEEILTRIWTMEGFKLSKEDFDQQLKAINRMLIFTSLTHLPTVYSVSNIITDESLIVKKHLNPFLEYYQKVLIPDLEQYQPDLIGISYSFVMQEHCGVSLTLEILKKLNTPIVAGGSYFSILCSENYSDKLTAPVANGAGLENFTRLLRPFGIYGEGEESLLQLCKCLEKKDSFLNIPRLVYYNEKDNTVKINHSPHLADVKNLPPVDLNGMPVNKKYLTPIPMAPLMSSRGCYWNKCAFCSHASVIDSKWREFPVEKIIQNLKLYQKDYGIEFVSFWDECMSPAMLEKLSKEILKEGINIKFGTMARFEKSFISILDIAAKAGLSFLSFGMESGCPRIVSLMKKGYEHQTAQIFLDECAKNGIKTQLHVMFGFPSETVDEARETIAFLEKNLDKVSVVRVNPWFLTRGSDIYTNMQYYGVSLNEQGFIQNDFSSYKVNPGISHQEAEEIINLLINDTVIGKKIINYGYENYFEEYYFIKFHLEKYIFANQL